MPQTMTHIHRGGRIVIPAAYRRALGLKPGDFVLVTLEDGSLRVVPRDYAIMEAQRLVREFVGKANLANELLEERRAEASRESRRIHPKSVE